MPTRTGNAELDTVGGSLFTDCP